MRDLASWLGSVYRHCTQSGDWFSLPGVASLLWPGARMSARHWARWLIDNPWRLRAVLDGFYCHSSFVLSAADLPGTLCSYLGQIGVQADEGAIRSLPPANVNTRSPRVDLGATSDDFWRSIR